MPTPDQKDSTPADNMLGAGSATLTLQMIIAVMAKAMDASSQLVAGIAIGAAVYEGAGKNRPAAFLGAAACVVVMLGSYLYMKEMREQLSKDTRPDARHENARALAEIQPATPAQQALALAGIVIKTGLFTAPLYGMTNITEKQAIAVGVCIFAANLYIQQVVGKLPGKVLPIKDAVNYIFNKAEKLAGCLQSRNEQKGAVVLNNHKK